MTAQTGHASRQGRPPMVAEDDLRLASRIDTSGTFSEEASFFGPGKQRLFGMLHRPTGPPRGGVVICTSIYTGFITGYRLDVSLARALASRGLAVQRFHYRGVGHSDGEADETTFTTMREDALAAADRLVERTGVDELAFLGTRFGGLVAASAASEHPGSALVLFEPTLEGRRFFRDAWRAMLIRDVKEGTPHHAPGEGIAEALEREWTVDVLGHAVCRPLFESAADRTLVGELGDGTRRVLLVQLGRASSLRGDLEAGAAALRELGCEVDVELIAEDVAAWFMPDAEQGYEIGPREQGTPHRLIGVTSAWLEGELAAALT